MSEKDLTRGLLEEFSIVELEQRLEFEAWCDSNCDCSNGTTCSGGNPVCPPVDVYCGGGGGGDIPDDFCVQEPY
jgi:hypothetical protein